MLVFNETSPHPTRVKASLGKVSSGATVYRSFAVLRTARPGNTASRRGFLRRLSGRNPTSTRPASGRRRISGPNHARNGLVWRRQGDCNPWVPEENLEGGQIHQGQLFIAYAERFVLCREDGVYAGALVLCLYNGGRGLLIGM